MLKNIIIIITITIFFAGNLSASTLSQRIENLNFFKKQKFKVTSVTEEEDFYDISTLSKNGKKMLAKMHIYI